MLELNEMMEQVRDSRNTSFVLISHPCRHFLELYCDFMYQDCLTDLNGSFPKTETGLNSNPESVSCGWRNKCQDRTAERRKCHSPGGHSLAQTSHSWKAFPDTHTDPTQPLLLQSSRVHSPVSLWKSVSLTKLGTLWGWGPHLIYLCVPRI